jgi:hypothetical protein
LCVDLCIGETIVAVGIWELLTAAAEAVETAIAIAAVMDGPADESKPEERPRPIDIGIGMGGINASKAEDENSCVAQDGTKLEWTTPIVQEIPNPEPSNGDDNDPQKKGRPENNQAQNKQVKDAAREAGLDAEQRRQLGRAVDKESRQYGANLSYDEILDIANDIRNGDYY